MRATLRFLVLLVSGYMATMPCPAQSLREQADSLGLNMGAAVRPSLFSEKAYSATLAREFNMVEAEDAMKWWVIRPDQKTFDFTQGDQVVAFADTHRMKVRGHTLVWMDESALADEPSLHCRATLRIAARAHYEGGHSLSRQGFRVGCHQ